MCTAISLSKGGHFFGRNLDLEYSFGEKVIVTPRKYPLKFRCEKVKSEHYAFIGMGITEGDFPLYYEATNEKGLSVAALSFPEAGYFKEKKGRQNIASFELIPWILCQCSDVKQCRELLSDINITDTTFSEKYPPSPLHWLISDKERSIVLECDGKDIKISENRANVLTNSPEVSFHLFNLNNYMSLSENPPENRLSERAGLKIYSKGMGAVGLPGDMSSMSRFVRGFFVKEKLSTEKEYEKNVIQFFHVLGSVTMPKGTVKTGEGEEYTVYSCCCDTEKGIYYYRTYFDSTVRAVDMHRENPDGRALLIYAVDDTPTFRRVN